MTVGDRRRYFISNFERGYKMTWSFSLTVSFTNDMSLSSKEKPSPCRENRIITQPYH